MTDEETLRAIENAIPKPANKHELGGDYYYTCYWLSCGNSITKYDQYCSKCGQRLFIPK